MNLDHFEISDRFAAGDFYNGFLQNFLVYNVVIQRAYLLHYLFLAFFESSWNIFITFLEIR